MYYSDPFIDDYKSEEVHYYSYYSFENMFSDEEIEYIKQWGEHFPAMSGEVGGDEDLSVNEDIRISRISWIALEEGTKWIFDRLSECAIIANKEMMWNFDLSGFGDEIQYTEYFGENNGHYSWHGDIGPNVPHRKLSIVVQLSDPEDYEGGELELSAGSYLVDGPNTKGTVIVFPSFVLHRVLPLTSGERRSLVSWISGPRLK